MTQLPPDLERLAAFGLLAPPQQMHRALHRHPDDLPPPRQPRWTLHPVKTPYNQLDGLQPEDLGVYQAIHQRVVIENQPASLEELKSLKQLVQRYPDLPALENLQAYVWKLSGNSEKYRQINQEMLLKYPDYLFARSNLAQALLLRGESEAVPELLKHSTDLGGFDAEPDRLFHISEMAAYYHVLCLWCLQTNRLVRAAYAFSLVYHPYPAFDDLHHLVRAWLTLPEETLAELAPRLQGGRKLKALKR
jgi:hypothetical protein